MNSAARALNNGFSITRINWISIANTPYQWAVQCFIMLILISGLAQVIVSNNTRDLYQQVQAAQSAQDKLQVQYTQLTLENSTLLTQARIEQQAHDRYGMKQPKKKELLVLS